MNKKKRLAQFKEYNGLVRFYIKSGQNYIDSHPNSKISKSFDTAIDWFYRDVFCEYGEEWRMAKYGLFGKPDFKAFLENYFDVKL